jgi:hypothetical protein
MGGPQLCVAACESCGRGGILPGHSVMGKDARRRGESAVA